MIKIKQKYVEVFGEGSSITHSNVVERVVKIMQWVQRFYGPTSGHEKKSMVMEFVRDLVDDQDDSTLSIFEVMVPSLIDTLIAVDQKNIRIHPKARKLLCFSCKKSST